jgi:hypothetical protein
MQFAHETAVAPACNDNFIMGQAYARLGSAGFFEQDFTVDPPGLRGLNRLAEKLNRLEKGGAIATWQLSWWKNRLRTVHGILFTSAEDLKTARLSITG